MTPFFQRRLVPAESGLAIAAVTAGGFALACLFCGLLFIPFGANPIAAYAMLVQGAFGSVLGFGQSLVQATPLIFIALATIVMWRAGLGYIGFEGCFLLGAASASWMALAGLPGGFPIALPLYLQWPAILLAALAAGAAWAACVTYLRIRFGGNDVLISLMMNYVAALLVQYLVSGPMREPGDLPETSLFPHDVWLPNIIAVAQTHIGIIAALLCAVVVWVMIEKTSFGYEMVVSGLNPKAARYGGIEVGRQQLRAAFIGGGLAALAGLCAVLGVQHRLIDGLSGGVGFIGIVVALLARFNPLLVIPTAILYGGFEVGGDAMQRNAGLPTPVILILESLVVLLILVVDQLRYYRINWPSFRTTRRTAKENAV